MVITYYNARVDGNGEIRGIRGGQYMKDLRTEKGIIMSKNIKVTMTAIFSMCILLVAAAGVKADSNLQQKTVHILTKQDKEQKHELQQIKKEVLQQVEDLRYGKDNLPQGNLKQASIIHENEEERLQLAVSQRKNLYLKGFVGSTLQNNQWQDLKRASYNGKHEGMLKWLENKNFSSSYQYSLYEKLSQLDDTSQKVEINNTGANKKYLYTPYSVSKKDVSSSLIQKDLNLKSNALFGTKNYSYTETSSVSPSELMTGSDWLNQPNKSQKKYLDTEAVYRQFVYENYQTVDQGLEKTIAHLFDQDEFENTGIYSISQHIRDTLTKYMKYDDKTNTQSENVLEDFLNQKITGNDVLFASAAVEAFRYYNIPARYVEGYLLKSDAIDEEGNATLTSKDGHAWV